MDEIEQAINQFLDILDQEKSFISNPYDYIYENITNDNSAIIVECLRYVIIHNQEIIQKRKENLKSLKESLAKVQDIKYLHPSIIPEKDNETNVPQKISIDIKSYVDLLSFSPLDEELEKKLSSLSHNDIKLIKLYVYKEKNNIDAEIRRTIISNPSYDITDLQNKSSKMTDIIKFLLSLEEKEELVPLETTPEISNIILLPHKKTSYLHEDILRYIENRKEIKNTIDKILDGYFLKTRDTKTISGFDNINLFEYRHPNGIRILYVAESNYIFICSLFYKDKQKSIKIENYYREAINRYFENIEYLKTQISSPDFYIEQAELVGQINSLLEQGMIYKKVGDYYE